MGYNSLGNIFFFGIGMYISAVVQVGLYYDVGEYTSAYGAVKVEFTNAQYFTGLTLGIIAAAIGSVLFAMFLSSFLFGLRGPYFAIGTLGVALAGGELIASWNGLVRGQAYQYLCFRVHRKAEATCFTSCVLRRRSRRSCFCAGSTQHGSGWRLMLFVMTKKKPKPWAYTPNGIKQLPGRSPHSSWESRARCLAT